MKTATLLTLLLLTACVAPSPPLDEQIEAMNKCRDAGWMPIYASGAFFQSREVICTSRPVEVVYD